ncbi:rRNA pseudouridine synthase [Erysipelothrix sp. HDW6C]|uniref:pseudouridine synthase n=1 Tax=Erysipelothrix sp. HDW6C TaxID=2714930 RepID=UPI00140748EC|nr:pseudouridine synthase [Erysipelothrix sp. HDW6C]QIK70184.1 rRNA pseudouridine synthase [Erysipelothrix sp. HDW6C]
MNSSNQTIRLQKYIAQAGVASRRKAEELIAKGKVKVNGVIVKEMGVQIEPGDEVHVDGKLIATESRHVYYILNKPRGVVSSSSDDKDRETVTNLVPNDMRVFPVGRLDRETTGALILTNDGNFANYMTHPRYDMSKKYRVSVEGRLTRAVSEQLVSGVTIEDVVYQGIEFEHVKYDEKKNRSQFTVTLHEGKNRQIRKMFAHFKLPVLKLHRFGIGPLDISDLRIGQYRELKPFEVKKLLLTAKGEI